MIAIILYYNHSYNTNHSYILQYDYYHKIYSKFFATQTLPLASDKQSFPLVHEGEILPKDSGSSLHYFLSYISTLFAMNFPSSPPS